MVEPFLIYSLQREKPVSIMLLEKNKPRKRTVWVLALEGEEAVCRYTKKGPPHRIAVQDILAASYARNDDGDGDV